MIKAHSLILAVVVTATGCTSTSVTSRNDADFETSINKRALTRTAKVTMRNGRRYEARDLRLEGDSVSFLNKHPEPAGSGTHPIVTRMAADEIFQVEFVSHGDGAAEGLFKGLLSGFLTGFAFGAAAAHEPCEGFLDFTCGSKLGVGSGFGVVFALPGAVVGLVGGGVVGRRYQYVFNPTHPPGGPQVGRKWRTPDR